MLTWMSVSAVGKGTILASGVDGITGKTRVKLDHGAARKQGRVDYLENRIAHKQSVIDAYEPILASFAASIAALRAELDTAIAAYTAAVTADPFGGDDELQEVLRITDEINVKNGDYLAAQARKEILETDLAQLNLKLETTNAYEAEPEVTAWCADYTDPAVDAVVGTIEVPGDPSTTLIVPGGTPYTPATDGEVIDRPLLNFVESAFNHAIFPGWQKWKPTYRFATIDAIYRGSNTCDLTLNATLSTAQSLNVNQTATLTGVEFDYMTCNHNAFVVADRVLVKFEGQSWGSPKVVGFEDNPVECWLWPTVWLHLTWALDTSWSFQECGTGGTLESIYKYDLSQDLQIGVGDYEVVEADPVEIYEGTLTAGVEAYGYLTEPAFTSPSVKKGWRLIWYDQELTLNGACYDVTDGRIEYTVQRDAIIAIKGYIRPFTLRHIPTGQTRTYDTALVTNPINANGEPDTARILMLSADDTGTTFEGHTYETFTVTGTWP